jgi:dihydroorotase
MILKNAKIYSDGVIREGAILISNGIIESIKFNPSDDDHVTLDKNNKDGKEIECEKRIILPGIIDIHSHLRDMDQSEKETFLTGTKAAAFSGITTVFDMPNTKPPAINAEQVKKWMKNARENIFVDVGFIAGVPKKIEEEEIKKIIDLDVIGFKIYPLHSLNEIDWKSPENIQKILNISSNYQIPIFIHADWPLSEREKEKILEDRKVKGYNALILHDKLFPVETELKYINFIIRNYREYINRLNKEPLEYPIVHFCHVSTKDAHSAIKNELKSNKDYKITFEVTPHHLILNNKLILDNENIGKVLPPLRDELHSNFLFSELKNGNIDIIGTDHAPHTLKEKSLEYSEAPSGFPGFETYPLIFLDKVLKSELSLKNFVNAASEKPAEKFKLKNKGFIKEGCQADLIIIEKVPEYSINSKSFITKAKFSPYDGLRTCVKVWKVFLNGEHINLDDIDPKGKIVIRK